MSSKPSHTAARGAPRSKKSHEAILAAALHLAETGGPQALTTEAVARQAGVGKQTIYRWWPTRIELLIEVYDTYAPPRWNDSSHRPLQDVLETLFELYLTGPAGELLAAMIALSRSSAEARTLFDERFRTPRRDALARYLSINNDVAPDAAKHTADLVVAMIWYALLTEPQRLDAAYAKWICATALPPRRDAGRSGLSIREGYVPGFGGDMIRLHMDYYAAQWGFGRNFERHLLRDFSALMETYDPARDQLIRVENAQGETLGTLVIEGSGQPPNHVRVRFFIMDERAKGLGLGRQMLAQALDTCRARGQTKLHLTTFKGLDAACTLYERAGFRLTEVYEDDDWNEGTGEVRYDLDLGADWNG